MKRILIILSLTVVMSFVLLGNANLHAATMDDRIESSAKQTYVFKTYLKNDDITVSSSDGKVTLTGTVEEEPHLSLAGDTVAGLPDVKSVDNKLTIKDRTHSAGTDAWLITKVKLALLFHKNVNAAATSVSAEEGVITLRGEASSIAQKDLTGEYAGDVEGVRSVNNMMSVSASAQDKSMIGMKAEALGEAVDDASITAMVKGTLLYHRSTSALNTNVVTQKGVVTLKGKAGNDAEKALAGKLANDVHGVKKVVNDMTTD